VATLNSRTHTGRQDATLTLEVAWDDNNVRRTGEAQRHVAGTIQHTIGVELESVAFVDVLQGAPPDIPCFRVRAYCFSTAYSVHVYAQ